MPRRARQGHAGRIEGALEPADLTAVQRWARRLGLRDWTDVASFAAMVETTAAVTLAGRMGAELGHDDDVALDRACEWLGISATTIRSRLARWTHKADSAAVGPPLPWLHASTTSTENAA